MEKGEWEKGGRELRVTCPLLVGVPDGILFATSTMPGIKGLVE